MNEKSYFSKLVHPGFVLSLILAVVTLMGGIVKLAVDKNQMENDFTKLEEKYIAVEARVGVLEKNTAAIPNDIKDINDGIRDIKFYMQFLAGKAGVELPIPPDN